jgi:haloacetate dehalogenase
MIAGDLEFFLRQHLAAQSQTAGVPDEDLIKEYLRCYRIPGTVHAVCEDYRAAATIDLEHDAADAAHRIEVPVLALWGRRGVVGQLFDVLSTWREKALDVRGEALDCGHAPQEELPGQTADALIAFLGSDPVGTARSLVDPGAAC